MSTMENLRQTGRTDRMLRDAIELANNGVPVIIIGATSQFCSHLIFRCLKLIRDSNLVHTINKSKYVIHLPRSNSTISFKNTANLNWTTLTVDYCTDKVLIDHYTIEQKYSKIIELLHKYDP